MAVDQMVLATQNWLNDTYGGDSRFELVPENGKTGWPTIYGLLRALQIELGIQNTSNNFGPTTQKLFKPIKRDDDICTHLFGIVQGALWCKGYNTGHYSTQVNGRNQVSQAFDEKVENAVKKLEEDAGRKNPKGIVDLNLMKALLSMDAFVCISNLGGDSNVRRMQQYLNGNYESYIGLAPCDGIYGRSTNKALIYAIQAEEGLNTTTANGNFGPSTRKYCPTIPYDNVATNSSGSKYNSQSISKFINILKIALYCNGYGDSELDGVFDLMTENAVRIFQQEYVISVTGKVNLGTWLSLMLSCGDTDRSAVACDTATKINSAKAVTLANAGYKYVGRYLTKVEGGLDKNLTRLEEKVIFDHGLSIFPIFQEYGGAASAFNSQTGLDNAQKAHTAAEELGIPHGTTIYYAVDFDPQQDVIINNILPYFKAIYNYYNEKNLYRVGVYGTRNVCRILKNNFEPNVLEIDNMFIADASYGFSGNLGFSLPKGWAFDQFNVDISVGSGQGAISIDKVAYSGKDNGYNKIVYTDIQECYANISSLYELALEYTNNNESESNELVLQYIRRNKYGNTKPFGGGSLSSFLWEQVAGKIDSKFCALADKTHSNDLFEFVDAKEGVVNDFIHLAATLNAMLWNTGGFLYLSETMIDIFAGWGGDCVSFAKDVEKYAKNNTDYQQIANKKICSRDFSYFSLSDYIADIDAINLYYYIKQGHSLPQAFEFYYNLKEYEKRTTKFINNIGGLNKFDNYCDDVVDSKYLDLHVFLAGIDMPSEYINSAGIAFKNFVHNKYNSKQ